MTSAKKAIGLRLRALREEPRRPDGRPRWTREAWAARLRSFADRPDSLPDVHSLTDMVKQWETGKHIPGPVYRPLYALASGVPEHELFSAPSLGAAPAADEGDYAAFIRDTNMHLVALDSRYGGTITAAMAVHAFTAARSALATGRHDADERELQAAAGETGEIAAWCLYDADRLAESRALTLEALTVSRLAGDWSMELFELSHLSLLAVHQRQPREALLIAEQVGDLGRLSPRVQALFGIRAARALAQAGEQARALDSLGRAAGALEDSLTSQDPRWTWWLDNSEMAWHRGIVHLELGDRREAIPHLQEAAHGRLQRGPYDPASGAGVTVRGRTWGRAAYNDLAHLLLTFAEVGAWSEAEEIMPSVCGFAREVASARTEVVLRRTLSVMARAKDSAGGPSTALLDAGEEIAAARGWSAP